MAKGSSDQAKEGEKTGRHILEKGGKAIDSTLSSSRKSTNQADTQSNVPLGEAPAPTFQLSRTTSSLILMPFRISTL